MNLKKADWPLALVLCALAFLASGSMGVSIALVALGSVGALVFGVLTAFLLIRGHRPAKFLGLSAVDGTVRASSCAWVAIFFYVVAVRRTQLSDEAWEVLILFSMLPMLLQGWMTRGERKRHREAPPGEESIGAPRPRPR